MDTAGITEAELTTKLANKLDYPTAQGRETFSSIAFSIPTIVQTQSYSPLFLPSDNTATQSWTWTLSNATLSTPYFSNTSNFIWTIGQQGGTQSLPYGQVSAGSSLLTPSILGVSSQGFATKENITFNVPSSPTYNAFGFTMGQSKSYNSSTINTLATIHFNNGADWYITINCYTTDITLPNCYMYLWIIPSF